MKLLWLLLLLPICALAQTINYNDGKFVVFQLKSNVDTIGVSDINWQEQDLSSRFMLNGPTPLTYSIHIENDTVAALSQLMKGKWQLQEKLDITDWVLSRIEGMTVISEFEISDLDKDGDEDLTVWAFSNVNGNRWTIVLINDQEQHRLVKLWNTAEDTELWDRPEFDEKNATLHTMLDAGVYGISNSAIYKLDGIKAYPVSKEEENRSSGRYIENNIYEGEGGKWKLVSAERISTSIEFQFPEDYAENDEFDWSKAVIEAEFEIQGMKTLYYKIRLIDDSHALLSQRNQLGEYILMDTIDYSTQMWIWPEPDVAMSTFDVYDFNEDGEEDLTLWTDTNVNGNTWMQVYLNDSVGGTLTLLHNTAENSYIWDDPQYDVSTNTISCTRVAGNYGRSYRSIYKLEGLIAIPLTKEETDNTQLNPETGKGAILRQYKGENGKWKLTSKQRLK